MLHTEKYAIIHCIMLFIISINVSTVTYVRVCIVYPYNMGAPMLATYVHVLNEWESTWHILPIMSYYA